MIESYGMAWNNSLDEMMQRYDVAWREKERADGETTE